MKPLSALLYCVGYIAIFVLTIKTWIGAGGFAAVIFFVIGVIAMSMIGAFFKALDGGEEALEKFTAGVRKTERHEENPYR